ncbi:HAD-IIIA family hydrolase [Fundidesulfovibrio butyratiphilus]
MRRPLRPGEVTARALRRARSVRLLVLDADGVLTNNALYAGLAPENDLKRLAIEDGMGVKLAQAADIEVAVLSGLGNPQVRRRMEELGVKDFQGGHLSKAPLFQAMLEERGLAPEQAAFMGDDWLDASALRRAGLALTVAGAQPEILRLAHWMSACPGGAGAVRQAIRFLLMAQGKRDPLWRRWLDD